MAKRKGIFKKIFRVGKAALPVARLIPGVGSVINAGRLATLAGKASRIAKVARPLATEVRGLVSHVKGSFPDLGGAVNAGLPVLGEMLDGRAGGEEMPLPALGTVLRGAVAAAPTVSRGLRFGRRRRRRSGLTLQEMGKIMVMGQALGKRSPAVTLMTMKAIGGRL